MAPAWANVTEDAPLNPSTPYAASKAAADFLLKTYAKQFGFPLAHGAGHQRVRGPAAVVQDHPALGDLPEAGPHDRIARRRPGGEVVHPHPRRVARRETRCSNEAASASSTTFRRTSGVECAHGRADSSATASACAFEDATRSVEERPGQDAAYVIDSTKARTELGWQPTIALKAGLNEVVDWVNGYWPEIQGKPLEYRHCGVRA